MSKESKRLARCRRVQEREKQWAKEYERVQGAAIGDPEYKLPEGQKLRG